jgi:hypothetical protein
VAGEAGERWRGRARSRLNELKWHREERKGNAQFPNHARLMNIGGFVMAVLRPIYSSVVSRH